MLTCKQGTTLLNDFKKASKSRAVLAERPLIERIRQRLWSWLDRLVINFL